jgi:hypothetical protein
MKRISILLLIFYTCSALAAWPQAQVQGKHKIIEFEAPGAGTGSGQGTEPITIDSAMNIVGYYIDSNGVYHGFLRHPHGHFTTVDDPNAGTGSGLGTLPNTIVYYSSGNWITGLYIDPNGVLHGFQRDPKGNFTDIDDPDAGTGAGQGTAGQIMNRAGEVGALYIDSNGVYHDVLLENGTFTNWDCLQAGTGPGQGTLNYPWMLNSKGEVTAECLDSNNVWHGSIRYPKGKIIDFDAPGWGSGYNEGTWPASINNRGWIVGGYVDSHGVGHGFVRDPKGRITQLNGSKGAQYTAAWSINSPAEIAGMYCDAQGNCQHGFVRAPDGKITRYVVPGACCGSVAGIWWVNMNDEGAISGKYSDSNGVYHGFLRLP